MFVVLVHGENTKVVALTNDHDVAILSIESDVSDWCCPPTGKMEIRQHPDYKMWFVYEDGVLYDENNVYEIVEHEVT